MRISRAGESGSVECGKQKLSAGIANERPAGARRAMQPGRQTYDQETRTCAAPGPDRGSMIFRVLRSDLGEMMHQARAFTAAGKLL